jgi:hypothetical protein
MPSYGPEVNTVADGPVPASQARLLFAKLKADARKGLRMKDRDVDELAAFNG